MRSLVLLTVGTAALVLSPSATGQEARADSTESFAYGTVLTYRAMLAQSRELRLIPTDPTVRPDDSDPFMGIGRLVVDETLSRTGSYFYDVFYRLWQPPEGARFVSVILSEQPLPGQGTLVSVRLDGELVFQSRLSPREEDAEALAQQAVGFPLRRLPQGDG